MSGSFQNPYGGGHDAAPNTGGFQPGYQQQGSPQGAYGQQRYQQGGYQQGQQQAGGYQQGGYQQGDGQYGPPQTRQPSKFLEFLRRDAPSMVAAVVTVLVGIGLFITTHLDWITGDSPDFDKVSITAAGGLSISDSAAANLSSSDQDDLASMEAMAKVVLTPFGHIVTVEGIFLLFFGLLMLSTGRRLAAAVVTATVVPTMLFLAALVFLGQSYIDDQSRRGDSHPHFAVGSYVTLFLLLVALVCAVVVFTRPLDGPRKRSRPGEGPDRREPPTGSGRLPQQQPPQQGQQYGQQTFAPQGNYQQYPEQHGTHQDHDAPTQQYQPRPPESPGRHSTPGEAPDQR